MKPFADGLSRCIDFNLLLLLVLRSNLRDERSKRTSFPVFICFSKETEFSIRFRHSSLFFGCGGGTVNGKGGGICCSTEIKF